MTRTLLAALALAGADPRSLRPRRPPSPVPPSNLLYWQAFRRAARATSRPATSSWC